MRINKTKDCKECGNIGKYRDDWSEYFCDDCYETLEELEDIE
mgnify:CR=1 FL=1